MPTDAPGGTTRARSCTERRKGTLVAKGVTMRLCTKFELAETVTCEVPTAPDPSVAAALTEVVPTATPRIVPVAGFTESTLGFALVHTSV